MKDFFLQKAHPICNQFLQFSVQVGCPFWYKDSPEQHHYPIMNTTDFKKLITSKPVNQKECMSSSISYNCCFRSIGRVVSTRKSPVSYPPPPPLIIIPLSNPIYIKDTFKYQLHTCNYLLMKSRNIMYSNFINNIYMTNIIKELINTWITRPILKLFKT